MLGTSRFVIFLLVYTLWLWVYLKIIPRSVRGLEPTEAAPGDAGGARTLLAAELAILHSVLGLFAFLWLLTRQFSLPAFGLFLLAAHLGVALTGILWKLMGAPPTPWAARARWATHEFRVKNPALFVGAMAPGLVALVGYPMLVGVFYYDGRELIILRVSLLALLLGWGASLPTVISTLESRYLDRETRDRVFAAQLGGMAALALYLSVTLWSLDIGPRLELSGMGLSFSPVILAALLLFFVLGLALPYVAGEQGARKYREKRLRLQKAWIGRALGSLAAISAATEHDETRESELERLESELEGLKSELEQARADLVRRDAMLAASEALDGRGAPGTVGWWERLGPSYRAARDLDPRIRYKDFLRELADDLRAVLDDPGSGSVVAAVERNLRERQREIAAATQSARGSWDVSWIIISFVLSILFTAVVQLAVGSVISGEMVASILTD